MRALIINADDFGLLSPVNQAIIDTYRAGSITSTTLMVNMPAAEEAVALARETPGLAVGLHLNLTCGGPVSDPESIPTLVDAQGRFLSRGELLKRCLTGRVRRAEVRREVQAQFARFAAFGLPMSHVDSHQHVHMIPLVFDEVVQITEKLGLPMRMPFVFDFAQRSLSGQWFKKMVLKLFVRRNQARLGSCPTNQRFLSIWDIVTFPKAIQREHYLQLLDWTADGVTELMVHPAYVTEELYQVSNIVPVSLRETDILLTMPLAEEARRRNIHLQSYWEMQRGR
ncbi:MAG: ChbG/HpnK family deacetylase [Bacillota bacterium]